MKLFPLFIFISLLIVAFPSSAQQALTVHGIVLDSKDKNPIAFVNIGIEGTLMGTATNIEGEYDLKIPKDTTKKQIIFSAIGYKNLSFTFQKFINRTDHNIELTPLSYGIEDIEINTQSKVLYRIVRETSHNISSLFIHEPFTLEALYQEEKFINQIEENHRDALIVLTDASGYGKTTNAYKARNYKFSNVKRNFDIHGLRSGTTLMDELLSLDIARSSGNILDISYLNEYDLELVETNVLKGDSVWVIAYQLAQPELSRTGDLEARTDQGKLYISKGTNILLKAEFHIESDRHSQLGRTIATKNLQAQNKVNYTVSVSYKSGSQGYLFDQITLDKNFENSKGKQVKITASLVGINENMNTHNQLQQRQYFENLTSDPNFWVNMKKNSSEINP